MWRISKGLQNNLPFNILNSNHVNLIYNLIGQMPFRLYVTMVNFLGIENVKEIAYCLFPN